MADNTADTLITATEKYVVPIFSILLLTTGTILFWPSGATLFQLTRLPTWITDYAGLAFIISSAILFFSGVRFIYRAISQRNAEAKYRAIILKSLWNLSSQEQAILREFVLFDADVQDLPFQDPAVLALRNKRILFAAAKSGLLQGRNMEFPFQLPSRIKEMLEPEMIGLREVQRLYTSNRPQFEVSRPHFRQPNAYW